MARSGEARGRGVALVLAALAVTLVLSSAQLAPARAWTKRVSRSCAECPCHAPGEPPPPPEEAHFTTYDEWPQSRHRVLDCLTCHNGTRRELLNTYTGATYDIYTQPSELCRQCHFRQYYDWKAGGHRDPNKACTDVECHNPHDPSLPVAEVLPVPVMVIAPPAPAQLIPPSILALLPYVIFAASVAFLMFVTGLFFTLTEKLLGLAGLLKELPRRLGQLLKRLGALLLSLLRALRPSRRASR